MRHAGAVEDTGLADNPFGWEPRHLLHVVRHQVERVGDHDDHGVGCVFLDT